MQVCPNRTKPIQVEQHANNMQSFAGPAVNEPLFIKRETVFRLTDFSKPNVGVIKLELTQNIGKHHLVVYASQFDPLPGDKLSYTPTDRRTGRKHNIPMPHFCLTNYDEVHFNMTKYFHSSKQDYLHMLKGNGGLTWDIVSMAIEYAETKKVNFLPQIHLSSLANRTRIHLLIRPLISGLFVG